MKKSEICPVFICMWQTFENLPSLCLQLPVYALKLVVAVSVFMTQFITQNLLLILKTPYRAIKAVTEY